MFRPGRKVAAAMVLAVLEPEVRWSSDWETLWGIATRASFLIAYIKDSAFLTSRALGGESGNFESRCLSNGRKLRVLCQRCRLIGASCQWRTHNLRRSGRVLLFAVAFWAAADR